MIEGKCPRRADWESFLLGQVVALEVNDLERHLETCASCRAVLASVNQDDEFVVMARSASADASSPAPQGVLEQLMDQLSELSGSSATVAEGQEKSAERAETTEELYDFLVPPQEPGEIGRFGPYRVLKLLGAGGMGVVFHAEDLQLRRHVALKVIRPALAASAAARRRFLREARAIGGLEHEHIVPILQVGEERGITFLTMPYLAGETLEDRLQREGRLAIAEVLRLGGQIAAGLAAAHARGLIHRDIKPANIWLESKDAVGPTSRVKLLDFGLVRTVGDQAELTHSNVIVGTPAYMAPEQADGAAVDSRTDLFSLGCVLYRMCTGQAPFAASTTLKTLLVLARGRARPPREINRHIPRALSDLILKLLARQPGERYSSAAAVAAELDAIAAVRATPMRHGWRRFVPAASLIVSLALVAWLAGPALLRREPPPDTRGEPPQAQSTAVFGEAVRFPAGLYPSQVAIGDFDRDGKLDLVVANVQSHAVSILPGRGDGAFGAPRSFPAGQWFAYAVSVADLDGDGLLDVIVVNNGSHQISVLRGNGDGTLAAPVQHAVGSGPTDVAFGDFNRDGKPDLAVTAGNGVSILLGMGEGRLAPAVEYAVAKGCWGMAVADFDGDGQLDLAVASARGGAVAILRGKGDGTFVAPVSHGDAPREARRAPLAGDVNGDGRIDLFVSDQQGGNLMLGRGDGTLDKPRLLAPNASPVALADFDRNGTLDLILVKHGGGLLFLPGNGDGTFGDGIELGGDAPNSFTLAHGDLDGDGALDLVVPNQQSNDVVVRLNRTKASSRHLGPPSFFPCGKEPLAVAIGDFNADGKPDVAVANSGDDTVSVLMGRGVGDLKPAVAYSCGKRPRALAVGDVNRDGQFDLVVACAGDDTVRVLLGQRNGLFAPAVTFGVDKAPTSVVLADLNRDGILDIATANRDSGSVTTLLGRGDGTFRQAVAQAVAPHPYFVSAADLNGDGRVDLVVAHRDQVGQVTLLLGDDNGKFRPPVVLPAGSYPQAVVVADFDRDGKLDLAVGNWGLGDVNLYRGNGDGSFRNPANFFVAGQAQTIAAADFDGDGRLDLIASDSLANLIVLARGRGDATIAGQHFTVGVGQSPAGMALADLDGDGRLDLVVANTLSNALAVLRNIPAAPYLRVSRHSDTGGRKVLAGSPFAVGVTPMSSDSIPDKGYMGTLRFSSSDADAGLPTDQVVRAADEPPPIYNLVLRQRGMQTITVADAANRYRPETLTVGVVELNDLTFRLDAQAQVVAGMPFTVTVNVMEKGASWVNNFARSVRFSATDPAATLPADFRFTGASGLHTFTSALTLRTPGRHVITVADTEFPALTGRATIQVVPPKK